MMHTHLHAPDEINLSDFSFLRRSRRIAYSFHRRPQLCIFFARRGTKFHGPTVFPVIMLQWRRRDGPPWGESLPDLMNLQLKATTCSIEASGTGKLYPEFREGSPVLGFVVTVKKAHRPPMHGPASNPASFLTIGKDARFVTILV